MEFCAPKGAWQRFIFVLCERNAVFEGGWKRKNACRSRKITSRAPGALDRAGAKVYNINKFRIKGDYIMKRIQTLETRDLNKSAKNGGCGECQTSCQSACKTSCTVANQKCENQ